IWSNFRAAMFDTDRMELGAKILQEAGDLIAKGQFAAANQMTSEAMKLFKPDMPKLQGVVDELRKFMDTTTQSTLSDELKYRAVLFCITLETLARLHSSHVSTPPWFLFTLVRAEMRGQPENHLITLSREWSEVVWYTGYFQPADFAPQKSVLSIDNDGHIVIDKRRFDEEFLMSRAFYLMD